MKKVLSLVLAVMMVVGMTTAAFAAITFPNGSTLSISDDIVIGEENKIEFTYTSALIATGEKGEIVTHDSTSTLPIKGSATLKVLTPFSTTAVGKAVVTFTSNGTGLKDGDAIGTGANTLVFSDGSETFTLTFAGKYVAKADPVEPEPQPEKPAGKVPSGWKITGFNTSYNKTWEPTNAEWNGLKKSESLEEADQKSYLPLVAGMFTWKNPKGDKVAWSDIKEFDENSILTSSQMSDLGIRRSFQKGTGNTIRDAELRTTESAVRVRTVKFYPYTKETDVELKLTLTYKGSSKDAPEYTYVFTIENEKEIIEEDQYEVYSYGNIYFEADYTVRNVEFQGDEDEHVFATKTVVKSQKYYFNVTDELEKIDEQMIADNPEIDTIYNVYQSNMANATVEFRDLDREFFVYDADGKLLGTTKDKKLPLARKYILTTAKVDFGSGADEEPTEEPTDEPADVDAPPMGGGEVPPSNNYNPNTGL